MIRVAVNQIKHIRWGIPGKCITIDDSLKGPKLDNYENPVITNIVDAGNERFPISLSNIHWKNYLLKGSKVEHFFSLKFHLRW